MKVESRRLKRGVAPLDVVVGVCAAVVTEDMICRALYTIVLLYDQYHVCAQGDVRV